MVESILGKLSKTQYFLISLVGSTNYQSHSFLSLKNLPENVFSLVANQTAVSCILGLSSAGVLLACSPDLALIWFTVFLPARLSEKLRAIDTAVILGIVTFLLVLVAVTFFYVERQTGPVSFLGLAYYGVPFLLISSGFGGYTTYAIAREIK